MTSATQKRLGIIGYGNIAQTLVSALIENVEKPFEEVICLVKEPYLDSVKRELNGLRGRLAIETSVVSNVDSLLALNPNYIVECAAHSAIREYGAKILGNGRDLFVISTGALSDDNLRKELNAAAEAGNAQFILVAGAIGGIDLLGAARLSGIDEVSYTSRKPPKAWLGTPAERTVNLADIAVETVVFEGSAREAALNYAQNANVAGTVALAGIGLDATRVRLIADPAVTANVHEIAVRSQCVNYGIRIEGKPSPTNPKTSLSAAYSLAYEVLNRLRRQVI
jgi:aspartate dehydrogenase